VVARAEGEEMKHGFDLAAIKRSLHDNPLRWVLLALLILAIYGSYRKEQDLAKLCELTGPHDVSVPHPLTTQQEITNICLKHESDD
jgi:hypothetical protein